MAHITRSAVPYRDNLLSIPHKLRNKCPRCEKTPGYRCVTIRYVGEEKLPIEVPLKHPHRERNQRR